MRIREYKEKMKKIIPAVCGGEAFSPIFKNWKDWSSTHGYATLLVLVSLASMLGIPHEM